MKRDILDIIYRWLIVIAFIFGAVFTLMMIGHSSALLFERIFNKEKSERRWHLIQQKFDHHIIIKGDSTFYWHQHPHNHNSEHPEPHS